MKVGRRDIGTQAEFALRRVSLMMQGSSRTSDEQPNRVTNRGSIAPRTPPRGWSMARLSLVGERRSGRKSFGGPKSVGRRSAHHPRPTLGIAHPSHTFSHQLPLSARRQNCAHSVGISEFDEPSGGGGSRLSAFWGESFVSREETAQPQPRRPFVCVDMLLCPFRAMGRCAGAVVRACMGCCCPDRSEAQRRARRGNRNWLTSMKRQSLARLAESEGAEDGESPRKMSQMSGSGMSLEVLPCTGVLQSDHLGGIPSEIDV